MPELELRFGYVFALFLMMGIAGGLLVFFRSQGWLVGIYKPSENVPQDSTDDGA